MTPENFSFWIQGVFEGKTSLTAEQQIQLIKDHLKLVLTKVTPVIDHSPVYVTAPHDIAWPHTPPIYGPTCSTAGIADGKICTLTSDTPANTLECSSTSSPEAKEKFAKDTAKLLEFFSGGKGLALC